MQKRLRFLTIFTFFLLSACAQTQSSLNTSQNIASSKTPKPIIEIKDETNGVKKDTPAPNMNNCVCVQLWMPVCGENAKTYSNSCFADCAKVKYTQGSCSKVITD